MGPLIVAALKDRVSDLASTVSFIASGAFLVVGFVLALLLSNREFEMR
jgi:hypothetical protein